MIGMVRLFAELYHDSRGKRSKQEILFHGSRADEMAEHVLKYGRGKLSPFAQIGTDFATQADFKQEQMPFSQEKPKKWLAAQGQGKYTWPNYAVDKLAPIPAEEAIREVWAHQGMDKSDQDKWLNAFLAFGLSGFSGIRYSPDYSEQGTGNR